MIPARPTTPTTTPAAMLALLGPLGGGLDGLLAPVWPGTVITTVDPPTVTTAAGVEVLAAPVSDADADADADADDGS